MYNMYNYQKKSAMFCNFHLNTVDEIQNKNVAESVMKHIQKK